MTAARNHNAAGSNFLQSVAKYYASGTPGGLSSDEIIYVLPNKRGAMFLKKYVRELATGVVLMPRFMTMRTFVSLQARRPEVSEREQLFILYDAYRSVMAAHGRAESVRDFDAFVFWGDMMLSDFDDIDRSMVNADDLFRNLRSVKEIQADYLDEDQKAVVRRVWGESRLTAHAEQFWLHLHADDDAPGDMAQRFVYLWEVMADIYHRFHELLRKKWVASAGMQYRMALDNIKSISPDEVPAGEHYAFVGFNDLSTVETLIFSRMRDLGMASFFWDTAPLTLADDEGSDKDISEPAAMPLRRLRRLVKAFPMPADYEVPVPVAKPRVTVTAVPSNIGQAKAVGDVLRGWLADGATSAANPLNTVIVIPDQGLLLPCLLSVPEDIEAVNISMGLPYRTTSFASLLSSIISMQMRARTIRGGIHFFYEDVEAVLAHPHIRQIAGAEAEALTTYIAERKLYNIPAADIVAEAPALKPIFTAVHNLHSVADVAAYLIALLDMLDTRLAESAETGAGGAAAHTFESEAIRYFKDEVEALAKLVENYGVEMADRTFLLLFERIFNQRGLTLNGTPLAGMQVLGVLETRALDFDNVIILSMNERVFPRKQYAKTMIPNNLRTGFGLPDFESLEWTYAYCFYRLIARARNVSLFYDSRADGVGNGEMSRYVAQMRYLMPAIDVEMKALSLPSKPDNQRTIVLEKDAEVMAAIDNFRFGGTLRLSASALKTYKKCPLRFYLEYARRMSGSDELVDYLSAADYGTVVHNTIQAIYNTRKGELINADVINGWLNNKAFIEAETRRQVLAQRYPKVGDISTIETTGEDNLAVKMIALIVVNDLEAERDAYCAGGADFTFVETEYQFPEKKAWHIAPGLDVNFFMSVDRVDRLHDHCLRFIDFKTGADKITFSEAAALFDRESAERDGIFQVLTYCQAYIDMVDPKAEIVPVIHSMRGINTGENITPIRYNKRALDSYSQVRADFEPLLKAFIAEIFDPAIPITQCPDSSGCKYCKFLTLCGRVEKKF